jgi:hypothetical protein
MPNLRRLAATSSLEIGGFHARPQGFLADNEDVAK